MIRAEHHPQEERRIRDLNSYSVLDSLPEEDYDNLTSIAAQICGTPISLISLVDDHRQWFKSRHGLGAEQTPKEYAFCAHAILEPSNVFVVNDARQDERFHDNPLVVKDPNVIFYAGVPLVSENGMPLGTLCVIDNTPRELSDGQVNSLKALSQQVMNLLELRKKKRLLEETNEALEKKNQDLERFAFVAAHDIKSPLKNIASLTEMLSESSIHQRGKETNRILSLLKDSSRKLVSLVDGLLDYSQAEITLKEGSTLVSLKQLEKDLRTLFQINDEVQIKIHSELDHIKVNQVALEQTLINLIANAIKYGDKEVAHIGIKVYQCDTHYKIQVDDNGPGIAKDKHDTIFGIFQTLGVKDRYGNMGNGIGLATVKKVVEAQNGVVTVASEPGKGTTFAFTIEK